MDSNVLPTPDQLALILHHMLVQLRNQSFQDEIDPKEVADVTDLAELIPLQFINRNEEYLRVIAAGLHDLAKKYPYATRYCDVLNLTAEQIRAVLMPEAVHA